MIAMAGVHRPQRPRDPNLLGKLIVDIATGEVDDPDPDPQTPAQVNGRSGGRRGGPARAAKLTAEQRSEIARRAARARWSAQA